MPAPIWIVIPVHNRRETTRRCLLRLRELALPPSFTVCVVDDGCTDGTSEMLAAGFPEVRVVRGDGELYWGGGIAFGMAAARDAGAEITIWLNDDCLPDPGSIEVLVRRVGTTRGICGAVCRDPEDPGLVTYSGAALGREEPMAPPPGDFQPALTLNGNLAAVHRDVVAKLGILDHDRFPHYGGDIAYTVAANRNGVAVEVAGHATAVNPRGHPFQAFGRTKPALALLREPFRKGSILFWPAYWRLLRLSYGPGAFVRWPSYFIRLTRLLATALIRRAGMSFLRLPP